MALPNLQDFTASNNADINAALSQWSTVGGRLGINTNAFYPDTTGGLECGARLNTESPNDDQYAQIEIAASAASNFGGVGAAIRMSSSAHSYYGFYHVQQSGDTQFFKEVSGTWTQFGSSLTVGAVGDVLRIEAVGTILRARRNGVQVATTTDSSLASGQVGITGCGTASTTATRGDNWQGGNVSVAKSPATFVGAGTADFTATSDEALTPGLPTGWAENDIHVIVCHTSSNVDIPTPSGYTPILPAANANGTVGAENNTAAQRVEVFWRRAQSGDGAPSVAAITSTAVRGAQVFGVRGCPTVGTPFSGYSRSNNAASATVTWLTNSVSDDDVFALAVYAYEDDPNAGSQPTDWSTVTVNNSNLGNDMALGYATRTYTAAGSLGSPTSTVSGGAFANSVNVGILIAFQPSEGGAAQTAELLGARERNQDGTLSPSPSATLPLVGGREQDQAGTLALVPGAITISLVGARLFDRAGSLTAASLTVIDSRGALERALAGTLQVAPGAVAVEARGSQEQDQAGAVALVPGAVTPSLVGVQERALVGTLQAPPGQVTVEARGSREGHRNGTLALTPGQATISLLGLLERAGAGTLELVTAPAQFVDMRGVREGDHAGLLALVPGAAVLDLRGGRATDRAGTSSLAAGAVTLALHGAREGDRLGTLTPALGANTVNVLGARLSDRAGTLAPAPGAAVLGLLAARATDRTGALAPAPGLVSVPLRGVLEVLRDGALQAAITGIDVTVTLIGVREGERAGSILIFAIAIVPGTVTLTVTAMGEAGLTVVEKGNASLTVRG